jgi:hypothetical protein
MKRTLIHLITFCLILLILPEISGQETQILYLSGTGMDNTVDWQFYCTASRNSGKWTTIPVPSNWELQGFGTYNYGLDNDSLRGKETGIYRYGFKIPAEWKGKTVNIVFEGSMTDTDVKINGKSAGPVHQGSFYRFSYDITSLLNYGKTNTLEVSVAKHSSDESVNASERNCDYWIFGGIFRPVYLEALPVEHIFSIAINALADGHFDAKVYLKNIQNADEVRVHIYALNGKEAGSEYTSKIRKGDSVVRLRTHINSPLQWSPEFPNLYLAKFTLIKNGKPVHSVSKLFGFRTVELREREGIYINGVRIKFKGICRHSFWPSSGRTMSKKLSVMDVKLMKDMNMNAVRMAHYPPDDHFLDICDSLGLFVIEELAGWHDAYDTRIGSKLVAEMIERDVNHPSIVIWANGNEGGHNPELVKLYDKLDIQQRPVIHPWETFRGTDTQHYINYDYGNGTHMHGHDVVFPTEFLHGLYDGGHGAGLEDYWEQMWHNPLSAGGFLWDFSDQGVVRTDHKGELDTDGDHAADGILGPYREKEGSYYTVKEVWAPIFFEHKEITPAFDGILNLENRFFFTNLNQCKFTWRLEKGTAPLTDLRSTINDLRSIKGTASSPDILPGHKGALTLQLPETWEDFNVLYVTAYDPHGHEIYTWSWPVSLPDKVANEIVSEKGSYTPGLKETDSLYIVTTGNIQITFNRKTGLLQQVSNLNGTIPFGNGPVLCEGEADFRKMSFRREEEKLVVENIFGENSSYKEVWWTVYPSGWLRLDLVYCPEKYESTFMGISFSFPEKLVRGMRWMGDGPYRVWKNRMKGTRLGIWEKDYNNTVTGESGYIYPEFKGYHSRLYWVKIMTSEQPFMIVCCNEDIFLRIFTPETPKKPYNTAPPFPSGDISFMHGIPPIGTKSQVPENMGPMGKKNMFYTYGKTRCKEMTLYFDFSGN